MILWIDDDRHSLKAFIDTFEEEGFKVEMVENPDEMWVNLEKYKDMISCIIMDIMLPTGSLDSRSVKMGLITGYELCKRLNKSEEYYNIPLIILTIVDDPEVIAWAREKNIPFLRKKRTFPKDLLDVVIKLGINPDK